MHPSIARARHPETRTLPLRIRLLAALLIAVAAATIGVLRPADAHAQFPYGESFQGATAPGFALGGAARLTAASGGPDTPGAGWLRLTPASNSQFGYAYNQTAFPSADGITYEFDYAAWGGSGADGLAFVLFDGATTDGQFNAGVEGGALGYSKCNGQPGLSNAYMGLGFDAFGYFSSTDICQQQSGIGPGLHPNRITVRGGAPNYEYLTSVLASGGVGSGNRANARRVSVTVLPKNGQTTLTASVRYPSGTVQQIVDDLVLPNPPSTLKFGFTASTGGLTNNHEIRGMSVSKPTDLQVEVDPVEPFADRDDVQAYDARITNAGPNPVTGVDLDATMPDTTDVEWSCTATGGADCPASTGMGVPSAAEMPVGSTLTYRITGTLTADADDSSLTVSAEPTGDTSEMAPDDNSATARTEVTPIIDVDPTYTLAATGVATAASGGDARGGNLTRSWQWLRCDSDGSDCQPISGATASTYTTTAADREANLRVRETVTNAAGSASGTSAAWSLPNTTVVDGPPTVTRETSAFEFSSTATGSTFECRLDAATTWTACGATVSYPDLDDGDHVLRVRAIFGGLADPEPATHSWTVDTTTSVAFAAPAAGPTNVPSPEVRLDGEAGAAWILRVDGNQVDAGTFDADGRATSTAVGPLADGPHLLRVDVEDEPGNVAYAERTLDVDTQAPVAPTIGDGPPPATSDQSAVIEFDVEPDTTAECRFDGGPWLPCTSPWKTSGLPDGPHELEIRSTDDAGNVGEVTRREWTVDTNPPDPVTWGDVPAPTSSDPTPTLTFVGEPGTQALCRVDGGPWEPCTSPWTLPRLDDGPHTAEVKIVDAAGNESQVAEHHWTVDLTPPPAPTVLAGPAGPTTSTTATFTMAGEPGATVECSLDGGPFVPCPATLVLDGLAVGDHVLRVRQTDAAGNVSVVGEHRWTVLAPDAPVPPPAEPKTATTRVPSKATVSDDTVRIGCAIDAGAIERCVVRIYERRSDGKRGALLGTGTVRVKDGRSTTVSVRLNARGKRVVGRTLGGRAVFVSSTVTARGGKTLRAKDARSRLFPQRLLTIPTVLPFAIDRGVVQGAARRVVADVAPQLRRATSVRCIGFTDDRGPRAHNQRLGLRRAQAVCRTLRQMGVRAKLRSSSRGEDQPRASNDTAAGRAKNRRVELVVRY